MAVAPALVVARLLVALGWFTAGGIADARHDGGRPRVHAEGLLAWDGTWYHAIASSGYAALPEEGLRFFPLFALLARVLAVPVGGSVGTAAVLVANLCAVGVAVGVLRLARREGTGEPAARRAAAVVSLFPASFVLVWAYSESLFLLGAVWTFLGARSQRWWLAVAGGFVAGATRPLGVLLVAPVVLEAVRGVGGLRGVRDLPAAELVARLAAVVAPLAGSGSYLAWVWYRFGDPLLPLTVQADFRGDAVNPVVRVVRGFGDLAGPERWGDGLHIPFAVAFVALAVWTFRVWPRSYGVFAALVLVAALAAENLNSLQRYALNGFPLAMTLAVLACTPRRERAVLAVCGCGVVSLAALAWLAVYVP